MIPWRAVFGSLLLGGSAFGSITAAWKIPIDLLAPNHEADGRVQKLQKPPGESFFFHPGDELLDVSKVLVIENGGDPFSEDPARRDRPWSGEWAVWNARSGMLIARGTHPDIFAANEIWKAKAPSLTRISFRLMRGEDGKTVRSASILARNGERTHLKMGIMSAEFDVTHGAGIILQYDVRAYVSWRADEGDGQWEAATAFTAAEAKETLVAKHGRGEGAWKIGASFSEEFPDGTPLGDARWIENSRGELQAWTGENGFTREVTRERIDDSRWLAWYGTPPDYSDHPQPRLPADLKAPDSLAGWVEGSFVDISKVLRDNGINPDVLGFFAGFDADSRQLVLVADAASQDRTVELLSQIIGVGMPSMLVETSPDSGGWGLVIRDGEKALLTHSRDQKEAEQLMIENVSAAPGTMEFRYEFDFLRPDSSVAHSKGRTSSVPNAWQKVAGIEDKEVTDVSFRATYTTD